MENEARTEIEQLGEFGLIEHLTKGLRMKVDTTVKGVGDDAAVIDIGKELLVVTTDMLVEGVHFDLMYVPLKHLGYKSVIVNLSDVYAMNARPEQITVSIAISNRFSTEALEELYGGIELACESYGVDLVGGDTTTSQSGLTISITAIGRVAKEKVTYRSTAKENDLLVVSGDLGGAYMGLQILEREKAVYLETQTTQPDLSGNDYILERQLKPEARKDIISHLDTIGVVPTSMIDISDGLASEAIHLAKSSRLGVSVFEDKIPIDHTTYDAAREFDLDPSMCALNGGEDYELLFTISQADHDKLKNDPNMSVIGHMSDESSGYHLITKSEQVVKLTAQGWDALLERELGTQS